MLKYPGIVTEDENTGGKVFWIEFPDFPEISGTQGSTLAEVTLMAEDCLGSYLEYLIGKGKEIPEPSKLEGENVVYITVPPEVAAPILIRQMRKSLGLTQNQVAERMKVSYRTVQNVERNIRKPSLETLNRIARAMGKHLIIDIT